MTAGLEVAASKLLVAGVVHVLVVEEARLPTLHPPLLAIPVLLVDDLHQIPKNLLPQKLGAVVSKPL